MTIQLLALFGIFVIGNIVGGYVTYLFFRFALHHSTVVGMEVITCENPECHRMHLRIFTLHATMGVTQTTFGVSPTVAEALLKAFGPAPVFEPPEE